MFISLVQRPLLEWQTSVYIKQQKLTDNTLETSHQTSMSSRDFCVDDGLKSVPTAEQALQLIKDTQAM